MSFRGNKYLMSGVTDFFISWTRLAGRRKSRLGNLEKRGKSTQVKPKEPKVPVQTLLIDQSFESWRRRNLKKFEWGSFAGSDCKVGIGKGATLRLFVLEP